VTKSAILVAWGRILRGQKPLLSIEITKECPLHCPGCYAYEPEHLGDTPLRQLADYRGAQLVDGVLALVRRHRPLHVSIIGGEPLVRYRELSDLLPKLERMGIEVQRFGQFLPNGPRFGASTLWSPWMAWLRNTIAGAHPPLIAASCKTSAGTG
jgi:4Fe-4S single cluster domain